MPDPQTTASAADLDRLLGFSITTTEQLMAYAERLRAALEAVKADEHACHSEAVWKQIEEVLAE